LCLTTEENFESALVEAAIKDKERKEALEQGTQDSLPPLHGIPVSIKEMVRYYILIIADITKRQYKHCRMLIYG
jgi:hypothetical protein